MKFRRPFLLLSILFFSIFACQGSTSWIANTVIESMNEYFVSDVDYREYNLKVNNITVLHVKGNQYKGLADIIYKNQTHSVTVDILSDGSSVMWEVSPEQFFFIFNDELEDLWDDFNF